jgi:hypothetical protein
MKRVAEYREDWRSATNQSLDWRSVLMTKSNFTLDRWQWHRVSLHPLSFPWKHNPVHKYASDFMGWPLPSNNSPINLSIGFHNLYAAYTRHEAEWTASRVKLEGVNHYLNFRVTITSHRFKNTFVPAPMLPIAPSQHYQLSSLPSLSVQYIPS